MRCVQATSRLLFGAANIDGLDSWLLEINWRHGLGSRRGLRPQYRPKIKCKETHGTEKEQQHELGAIE